METVELKRPTFNDEMRLELAKIIGKEVYDWCNGDTDLEDCINDCNDVFRLETSNAFEMAKDLERKGYSPDAELVEIMDGVYYEQSRLVEKAVKQWVIDNDIQPPIKGQARVMVKYGWNKVEGIIVGVYADRALYKVCIPSEGMTVDGDRSALIKYEDATEI